MTRYGGQSLTKPLKRALVHSPGNEYNAKNWSDYGYLGKPDADKARRQHGAFLEILTRCGVELEQLGNAASIQSLATTDPALILNTGAIILNSGKEARRPEAWPMARKLVDLHIPIVGWLTDDARCDGGDLLWLNDKELVVGRSYRTNPRGIDALRIPLGAAGVKLHVVSMPHWEGPGDVLHLMSAISLVRDNLAVIYRKPLPLALLDLLADRDIETIDIPDAEFETQACNVLSINQTTAVMCAGNIETQTALEERGVKVLTFDGTEFCARRGAGPTCHVLPILRRQ